MLSFADQLLLDAHHAGVKACMEDRPITDNPFNCDTQNGQFHAWRYAWEITEGTWKKKA